MLGPLSYVFFFNDTATTEIYTLSLHDALPISAAPEPGRLGGRSAVPVSDRRGAEDRKSTRLNSSHDQISYAVFCLKKKKYRRRLAASDSSPLKSRARSSGSRHSRGTAPASVRL